MKTHFTIEEIKKVNEICLECDDHICNWASLRLIYFLKYKTDSPVFLVDKCEKLKEIRDEE